LPGPGTLPQNPARERDQQNACYCLKNLFVSHRESVISWGLYMFSFFEKQARKLKGKSRQNA